MAPVNRQPLLNTAPDPQKLPITRTSFIPEYYKDHREEHIFGYVKDYLLLQPEFTETEALLYILKETITLIKNLDGKSATYTTNRDYLCHRLDIIHKHLAIPQTHV